MQKAYAADAHFLPVMFTTSYKLIYSNAAELHFPSNFIHYTSFELVAGVCASVRVSVITVFTIHSFLTHSSFYLVFDIIFRWWWW